MLVLAGSVFVKAKVLAEELPQLFTACTLTFPPVNSAVFTLTVIVFVVEVPVKPTGKAQVYDVAPVMAVHVYVAVVSPQI
jgi:hypothetical protein